MKRELIFLSAAAFLVLSTAIGVRQAAARPCDITVPTDFGTIEAALAAALDGDKICIKSGTYPENALVVDTANLHIVGSGFPIIQGTQTDATPNIDIQAAGVTIEKLKFEGTAVTGTTSTIGINVGAQNVVIRKNRFMVPKGDGMTALQTVAIQTQQDTDVSGLEISKNRFDSFGDNGGGYTGIYFNPDSTATNNSARVTVDKNRFDGDVHMSIGTARPYVYVEKNKMGTNFPNSFAGDPSYGVGLFDGSHDVDVEKNKIGFQGTGQFFYGIYLAPTVVTSSFEKNFVKSAADTGIYVSGDNNDFMKNKAMNAVNDGIFIDGDNNSFKMDIAKGNGTLDINDMGTGNTFFKEKCQTSSPTSICE